MMRAQEEIEVNFKCGCITNNTAEEMLITLCRKTQKDAQSIVDCWDKDIEIANRNAFRKRR